MRNPEYRFVHPDNTTMATKAGIVWKHAGAFRHDYLRSKKHAIEELRSRVSDPDSSFYRSEFTACAHQDGYSDAIGFSCGRHRESAACPVCSGIQRLQLADIPMKRGMFDEDCMLITIFDDRQPIGELHHYEPRMFISNINRIAEKVRCELGDIKAIGHLEYVLKRARNKSFSLPQWAPHIHIIASGSGVEQFVSLCREKFRSEAKGVTAVQAQLMRRDQVNHTFQYIFKAPFAKNIDRRDLAAHREAELSQHLLDRTCSELLWTLGIYIPDRTIIASKRDISIWNHTLGRYNAFSGRKRLRIIPKVAVDLKRGLFNVDGEINQLAMKKGRKLLTAELLNQIKSSAPKAYREVLREMREKGGNQSAG